ncbi:hypothetical protein [Photobacterium phosphoreum]|uniref:hypothetical protein n=1 Tax=Photobacterium phosphoreum TaxID=659 RepID=UPI00242C5CBF|nr:hypothetical protein [Photobacterium phosphoreum]
MDTEFDYIVRAKAEQLGVPVGAIFAALATKRVNGEMGEDDPTEVVLLLSKKDVPPVS